MLLTQEDPLSQAPKTYGLPPRMSQLRTQAEPDIVGVLFCKWQTVCVYGEGGGGKSMGIPKHRGSEDEDGWRRKK